MNYDLECKKCGHAFEHRCSILEAGEGNWPPCPICDGETRRKPTAPEIRYIGRDFTQREKIIEEHAPGPGFYEPEN